MRYLLVHGAWIGVAIGGVWMLAVRPAHSKPASVLLVMSLLFAAGSLFVRGLVGITARRNERIRRISEGAAAALARDGFTVVDSLLGERYQNMVAVDDQQRVALCDLGPRGTVLGTKIVAADQVQASSVVNDRGGTSLVLKLAGERRELVIVSRTPTHDGSSDEAEQTRIAHSVRWWCERLMGRQPTDAYQVSLCVGSRASGQAFDAAVGREIAKRGLVEVPKVRIVEK